jgi:Protein of unknown function (DUF3460)
MAPFYFSEVDQFLNKLKVEHPDVPEQQKKGRALLWDKLPTAPDGCPSLVAEPLKQPGYVYFENSVGF